MWCERQRGGTGWGGRGGESEGEVVTKDPKAQACGLNGKRKEQLPLSLHVREGRKGSGHNCLRLCKRGKKEEKKEGMS